jgi:hypothetical chaperone protein
MPVGIDFGTTNSVLALADAKGQVRVARHGGDENFRSILCFVRVEEGRRVDLAVHTGPAAIEAYRTAGAECRLIQSIKSFVASPNFTQTTIFNRKFTIEDLVALILRGLRASAESGLGPLGEAASVGRPVRFAGDFADEALALKRLTAAYAQAGFADIAFTPEPLAAAYKFAREIYAAQTCLIGDFGGGTSDFSVVRFSPRDGDVGMETLATSGVGVAGDMFDYRIMQNAVAPLLGRGSHYLSFGKWLQVPLQYYARFQRWNHLSMMRNPKTLGELREIARGSETPEKIERLIYVIEEELGFDLYRAVATVKAALSRAEAAALEFDHGPLKIARPIARGEFDQWIEEDLESIDAAVSALFAGGGLRTDQIDRVFMTGGASLVPAVRALVARRFPGKALSTGDEFVSVGAGLALSARDRAPA